MANEYMYVNGIPNIYDSKVWFQYEISYPFPIFNGATVALFKFGNY